MAIDTASRRAAASTFGRLPVRVLPIPDSTIGTHDRAYLVGCWPFNTEILENEPRDGISLPFRTRTVVIHRQSAWR